MDEKVMTVNLDSVLDILSSSRSSESPKMNAEDIDLEIRKEDLEGQKQDRDQRKKFANKIFWMLVSFLGATVIITVIKGFGKGMCFDLSDTILITLLATTTANVIGIFLIVVRYLFKSSACPRCGVKISSRNEITTNM